MIRHDRDGGCIVLTIDRPEKAGALTKEMLVDLADHVQAANTDETVKTLILTGTGQVFSAGADLEAARAGLAVDGVWERLSGAIDASPILTISALNGTVAGGAMGMVLATDLRVATPSSKAFYPVMKLGFLPQPSDAKRLAALVGPARAKLILMAGQKLSADEALAIGLFDRLSETPMETALELALDAMDAERAHIKAIKALIRQG